jgi:hypothetical protein
VQLELKRSATFVVALGFGIFVGSSKVDAVQADFDGFWVLDLNVEQGQCTHWTNLSFCVQIYRGSIKSARNCADNSDMIDGHVGRNGSVDARVRRGKHSFWGKGILSHRSGSGSWQSSNSSCAGSWSAYKQNVEKRVFPWGR